MIQGPSYPGGGSSMPPAAGAGCATNAASASANAHRAVLEMVAATCSLPPVGSRRRAATLDVGGQLFVDERAEDAERRERLAGAGRGRIALPLLLRRIIVLADGPVGMLDHDLLWTDLGDL